MLLGRARACPLTFVRAILFNAMTARERELDFIYDGVRPVRVYEKPLRFCADEQIPRVLVHTFTSYVCTIHAYVHARVTVQWRPES